MGILFLVQQQQLDPQVHALIRPDAMIDGDHRGIRDELLRKRELVLGQAGDEYLGRPDRILTLEGNVEPMASAGESHAGPALLRMGDELRVAAGEGLKLLPQAF